MPRKANDDRLETKAARLRLAPRNEPYWRQIQQDRFIGYRRTKPGRAGQWKARFFDTDAAGVRRREFTTLGSADDLLDADGIDTLSFAQAQEAARKWFADITQARRGTVKPITVSDAMADYVRDYVARGGKHSQDVQRTIAAHIAPKFGNMKVSDLTAGAIREWLRALATAPPRLRQSQKPGALTTKAKPIDPENYDRQRARRNSANRILTVLKAGLNLAFADGKVLTDEAWRRVLPFKNVEQARIRFFTDSEAVRLTNSADPDFRPLVVAALLTGARYSELTRLEARDFSPDTASLHIRTSKTGKSRYITLNNEGKRFFIERCAGKVGTALILPQPDGEAWGKSDQIRPMRAACAAASISPPAGFHILRHTHASRLTMAGVPLGVVAAQLGNSEAICAKHYSHLSPGYVSASIRGAFPEFGIVSESNLRPLTNPELRTEVSEAPGSSGAVVNLATSRRGAA